MRSLRTATKGSPRSPQLEKARVQQRRPNAAKINKLKKKSYQNPKFYLKTLEKELQTKFKSSRKKPNKE